MAKVGRTLSQEEESKLSQRPRSLFRELGKYRKYTLWRWVSLRVISHSYPHDLDNETSSPRPSGSLAQIAHRQILEPSLERICFGSFDLDRPRFFDQNSSLREVVVFGNFLPLRNGSLHKAARQSDYIRL